jgi:hypothetical protein
VHARNDRDRRQLEQLQEIDDKLIDRELFRSFGASPTEAHDDFPVARPI